MRISIRRDESERWEAMNPRLQKNEPALETDTGRVKLGDGKRPWNQLPYTTELPVTISVVDHNGEPVKVKIRRDTAEEIWQYDPPMIVGECVLETDTGRTKVATTNGPWSDFYYLDEIEAKYAN